MDQYLKMQTQILYKFTNSIAYELHETSYLQRQNLAISSNANAKFCNKTDYNNLCIAEYDVLMICNYCKCFDS